MRPPAVIASASNPTSALERRTIDASFTKVAGRQRPAS
jgi:hypothetical protein